MITKICKTCGKEFAVHNYREHTSFYCSISCSKIKTPISNIDDTIKKCPICGKEFNVKPCNINKSIYCSFDCYKKSKKGKSPWNKNIPMKEETKKIQSEQRKGKCYSIKTQFKKGLIPWNKGKNQTSTSGEKNINWKGGVSKLREKERKNIEIYEWKRNCLIRDDFTCQKTGIKGGDMQIHHILNFSEYPELRTNIENGITLSKESHKEFHKIYGYTNNTKEQLIEFLNN